MKALIIGATGATGKDLVKVLLQDPDYTEIVTFVRHSSEMIHPKLTEVVTDFGKLENVAKFIAGDVWFSLLGTTLKNAGSKDKQWHIDYEIPSAFAEIAKQNGVQKAVLLSAYGASTSSKVFYSKIKGSLEEKIGALSFKQYIIFRPGLLLRKKTNRYGERLSGRILGFLNNLGLLRRFRPMPTFTLAQKMAKAPTNLTEGRHVIELNEIFNF